MLQEHASIVMNEIDKSITELDNAEATHQKLLKIGQCHKTRGLKEFFLWEIREPFLRAVEFILGDRYTDRMKTIYQTYIEYLIRTMIEGYK